MATSAGSMDRSVCAQGAAREKEGSDAKKGSPKNQEGRLLVERGEG